MLHAPPLRLRGSWGVTTGLPRPLKCWAGQQEVGSSPPRLGPLARGLEPLPTGQIAQAPEPLPWASHLGCPGVLDQGTWRGRAGEAARPPSPGLWGPTPAPVLLRLPWRRQWGQGLVPLPQLKIAAGFVESPWGGGGRSSHSLGCGGVRPGRKCLLPCPLVEAPVSRQSPLESPGQRPQTYVGQESPGSLGVGFP